jgi:predicted nucleic acid-binding protein
LDGVKVVFDSSVIVGAAGWRGESYLCLVAMARRRAQVFVGAWILEAVRRTASRLQAEGMIHKHDPWPVVNWFALTAKQVQPLPTGKPRSRDAEDDPVIGTALAGECCLIVTTDLDLLVLEKPFGISIVRPREFLAILQRPI